MNQKEKFESIYRATFPHLSKQVYFKVAKLEDAQDIVQEVYMDFYRYIIQKDKDVDNVQAYLLRMANNKLSQYYKDKALEIIVDDNSILFNSIQDPIDIEEEVLEKISIEEIWAVVKELPLIDQHILIDYYRFGYNFREIAQRYQMPESTIKSRSANAIKYLKNKFI